MPQRLTLDAAVSFWRQHNNADPESVWDRFIAAEAFILDHVPGTAAEAELLFEVLLEQGPDSRGDGRDRQALERLRAFVRGLHPAEAVAA
jgi:hypothetical protein